jgi:transcriptional regulator with XRE-family HTH domain
MTPVDQHVVRRIRGKRRALALTENDLAKALGVDRGQIEAYEHGTMRVPPEHLIKLSDVLGVPVSYFFPPTPCPGP